jgi:flagellar basal-body rod modification protein FlgD
MKETSSDSSTSSTSSSSSSTSGSSSSSSTGTAQTLDQNDFLTLLIKQMTNQDPLNPQSDTEFASQMAQFTALEQTKTLVSKMSDLSSSSSLQQASSLIGKTVTVTDSDSTSVQGVVSGVAVSDGTAQIVINGTTYGLSSITSISNTNSDSTTTN